MRLVAPVTRGYFFSLSASYLVDAPSPRTINIVKKKISSGTQGIRVLATSTGNTSAVAGCARV